jgi:hypothetical protein
VLSIERIKNEWGVTKPNDKVRMVDIPLSLDAKVTVERRGQLLSRVTLLNFEVQ